jgi:cytoskeletal protein CcmA (bactofilin family)
VTGNFLSLDNVTLNKEIYVEGKASVGESNTVRALAAEGKVSLASRTKVIRWVDAEGEFIADFSCDLGWSISSARNLILSPDCRFRRLYGTPVRTRHEGQGKEISDTDQQREEIGDSVFISDRDWTIIPPFTTIDKTLIFKQNLRIKKNCVMGKDVKTYRKLVLEEGVRIKGNVFAENGISTGPLTRIFGNVFSQDAIYLGKESRIGRTGAIKSVVARKEIVLDRGVVIYGYVVAGKRGRVL